MTDRADTHTYPTHRMRAWYAECGVVAPDTPRLGAGGMVVTSESFVSPTEWRVALDNTPPSALVALFRAQYRHYGMRIALLAAHEQIGYNLRGGVQPAGWGANRYTRAAQEGTRRPHRLFGHKLGALLAARDIEGAVDLLRTTGVGYSPRAYGGVQRLAENCGHCVYTCPCCDRPSVDLSGAMTHFDESGYRVCAECVDDGEVVWSDEQGCYIRHRDCVQFGPDDLISGAYAERQGYRYNRANGWYEERCDDNNCSTQLHGYHEGPTPRHIPSAFDTRTPRVLMGLELEVEYVDDDDLDDDESESLADTACGIADRINAEVPHYMKVEKDGSLNHGFEMITGYTGLDVHAKAIKALTDLDLGGLRSHDTTTCGLHVHLDKEAMTVGHAARFHQFINAEVNRELVTCVARRYGTDGYAKRCAAQVARTMHSMAYDGVSLTTDSMRLVYRDRYVMVNWNNDKTVELRCFRGSLRYHTIMACLEFSYAAWHFTRTAGLNELDTTHFMKFICAPQNRKDTVNLRGYLKAKQYRSFYQAEQVVRPKDKSLREAVTDVHPESDAWVPPRASHSQHAAA